MEYHLSGGAAAAVTQYTLIAGNDFMERDPSAWRVEGKLTVGSPWVLLDVRSEQKLGVRLGRSTFAVSQPCACVAYRLVITSTAAPSNCIQLTGWEMSVTSAPSASSATFASVLTSADTRALSAALRTVRASADAAKAFALVSKILRAVVDQPCNDQLRCGPPCSTFLFLSA